MIGNYNAYWSSKAIGPSAEGGVMGEWAWKGEWHCLRRIDEIWLEKKLTVRGDEVGAWVNNFDRTI